MTDNISRMYELAGIEKYYLYTVKHLGKIHIAPLEGILENKHLFERNKKSKVKNTYINRVKKVYPPFTDTTELELIKLLARNFILGNFKGIDNQLYNFNLTIATPTQNKHIFCEHKEYEQALAGLVCELWEDLTDTQREEVRGILQ